MKRILVTLVAASGLALLAAAPAGAVSSLCGHSYAILLQGAAPNHINQTGTGDNPGALTAAAGVGEITFGTSTPTGCATVTGEMIFNQGDIQSNGEYFGPADCYDSDSLLTTGLPCFDGQDHFAGSSLTTIGANGFGTQDLVIDAGYNWFDTASVTGFVPFAFTMQANSGGSIIVGTSKPVGPATDAPVLTITLQKIGVVPVATTYGAAPYLGNIVVSCSAYGANSTDFVANGNGNGLTGGFGSVIGDVEIFSIGNGGGAVGFNSNNNATASGFTGTQPSNNDCSIAVFPGTADPGYASGNFPPTGSQFADGASNSVASIDNSSGTCTDDLTAGAGYANCGVAWGSTDTASYLVTVGVVSTATGFVPPGTIGTCTTYAQAPAGKLTSSATATQTLVAPMTNVSVTKNVKITNTSPADCHVSVVLGGTLTDGNCTVSLTGGNTDVKGDFIDSTNINLHCVCTGGADTVGPAANLTVSSPGTYPVGSCPVSVGAGPVSVVCKK